MLRTLWQWDVGSIPAAPAFHSTAATRGPWAWNLTSLVSSRQPAHGSVLTAAAFNKGTMSHKVSLAVAALVDELDFVGDQGNGAVPVEVVVRTKSDKARLLAEALPWLVLYWENAGYADGHLALEKLAALDAS